MFGRIAFVLAGACVVIALAQPHESGFSFFAGAKDDPGVDAMAGAHSAQNPAQQSAANSAWYQGGHTLSQLADGHFYADAYVNGTNMRMLIDTGASAVVLTGDDARAAGLSWDEASVRQVARGASGPVFGVTMVLDEVDIGGIALRGVQAAIVPEGLHISVVGQSYLNRLSSIEIEDGQMLLVGP